MLPELAEHQVSKEQLALQEHLEPPVFQAPMVLLVPLEPQELPVLPPPSQAQQVHKVPLALKVLKVSLDRQVRREQQELRVPQAQVV